MGWPVKKEYRTFGEWFRLILIEKKVSQRGLARALKLHKNTIRSWTTEENTMSLWQVGRVAKAIGVTPTVLANKLIEFHLGKLVKKLGRDDATFICGDCGAGLERLKIKASGRKKEPNKQPTPARRGPKKNEWEDIPSF